MKSLRIHILSMLLLVALSTKAINRVDQSTTCDPVLDSLELTQFFQAMDGLNWTNNTNWLVTGQPIESWYGITVNNEGCVTTLQLYDNNLSGTLYDFNFPDLNHLILSIGSIQGSIPDFSGLPELQTLWINDNLISGNLPDFQNTPKLVNIYLSNNDLIGTLPDFSNLTALQSLSIWSNKLEGPVVDFSNTPNLLNLSISNNLLSGEIPDFEQLPQLQTLDLRGNQLSGSIPDFSNIQNLQILFLGENRLTGSLPDFSNLPFLKELSASDNLLKGSIPDFNNLPQLEYLNLSTNQFTGEIPDFSKIPQLQGQLWLTSNLLSGPIPDFSKIPKLTGIFLRQNQLSGPLPDFSNLPDLTLLDLSSNKITGPIPNFSSLLQLQAIWIDKNKLSGQIPDFNGFPNLDYLQLDNNNLVGTLPSFNNIPNLSYLGVNNNLLSGDIPSFPNADYIHIENNNYTFSDIISSGNLAFSNLYYNPQNLFFHDTTIMVEKNSDFIIDLGIDNDLTTSFYFWAKDSMPWTPPPGNSNKSNKLIFNDPDITDAGRYTVSVFNPQADQLALHSYTVSLQICDRQHDSLELVKLFNSTNGDNWKTKSNWLVPGKPLDSWHGIHVNHLGCVHKIDLSNNDLTGSIPVLDLNTLDTLILEHNSLSDTFPDNQTPFLKALDVSHNQLSGQLPDAMFSWMNLHTLDLGSNIIDGSIPPDLGDLCELTTLRLDHNIFTGELPEALTMLTKLKKGQVDFQDNDIDSLNQKIIWFCPYGDTILQSNPSYDRFLGICNVQCNGDEWENLENYLWVADTINAIDCQANCAHLYAQAGFLNVRGVRVMFTLTRCYSQTGINPVFNEVVRFFDCGGHLLETVYYSEGSFQTDFGAINEAEFAALNFDIQWICGQTLDINTSYQNPGQPHIETDLNITSMVCSPNPTTEWIICNGIPKLQNSKIRIVNSIGQRILAPTSFQGEQVFLDLQGQLPGLYVITIQSDHTMYIAKVILQ